MASSLKFFIKHFKDDPYPWKLYYVKDKKGYQVEGHRQYNRIKEHLENYKSADFSFNTIERKHMDVSNNERTKYGVIDLNPKKE